MFFQFSCQTTPRTYGYISLPAYKCTPALFFRAETVRLVWEQWEAFQSPRHCWKYTARSAVLSLSTNKCESVHPGTSGFLMAVLSPGKVPWWVWRCITLSCVILCCVTGCMRHLIRGLQRWWVVACSIRGRAYTFRRWSVGLLFRVCCLSLSLALSCAMLARAAMSIGL